MTYGDRIVVLVVAALAVAAWPIAGAAAGASSAPVAVVTGPDVTYHVPLDADRRLEVRGLESTVTVVVGGGFVSVVESGCRDHLCVRRGPVATAGAAVVCAPNGVTIRIGGRADAPDALVR